MRARMHVCVDACIRVHVCGFLHAFVRILLASDILLTRMYAFPVCLDGKQIYRSPI